MKVLIPGGSGQVGTLLARALQARGDEVVVLSRTPDTTAAWQSIAWDGRSLGPWAEQIDGADVVINLAGRSVDCRYGKSNRESIMNSRVDSTRVVGAAIAQSTQPPKVWLQASTATIYAHSYDVANDETTGVIGSDESAAPDTWRFSIDVARTWEKTLDDCDVPNTRKVAMRSAMTMSADRGGIFDVLLRLVRLGLGGTIGDGKQFVSWIHGDDFVRAVERLIVDETLVGPINLAAPEPVPYAEFMRTLRKAYGKRIGLPATKWMLEIGAFVLRTESELVLKSRRVVPGRLLDVGFEFQHPTWDGAATALCSEYSASK